MKHAVLAAMAALCLGVAPALPVQAQQKVNITQAVASFAFLPIDYAKAAGYFADEGLEVQQIATRGGGPDLTALISGDVQFNAAAGTYQVGAIAAGRDIVNVYNFYNRNLIGLVLSGEAAKKTGVPADAPLEQRLAALKGMNIGMTRPGSLTDKQVRHLLTLGGLTDQDAQIVAIGGPPNLLSALNQGAIDGFAISVPHYQIAAQRQGGVIWVDNTKGDDPSIDPFMMESILATREYTETNPEVVRKMVKAVSRAVARISESTPEEVRAVVQPAFPKVEPDVMLIGIEAIQKTLNLTGEVSLKMAENTMLLDGRTDQVSAQQLFDTFTPEFLPK
jgi:NitT/TauT family transport system substrate-binding protein